MLGAALLLAKVEDVADYFILHTVLCERPGDAIGVANESERPQHKADSTGAS